MLAVLTASEVVKTWARPSYLGIISILGYKHNSNNGEDDKVKLVAVPWKYVFPKSL